MVGLHRSPFNPSELYTTVTEDETFIPFLSTYIVTCIGMESIYCDAPLRWIILISNPGCKKGLLNRLLVG
jgi:hypothetical protein